MEETIMMTEDDFKNYKSGDKLFIRLNPDKKTSAQLVYFKSVEDGHLNYEDMNFRKYSVELSALTPP
jgi:hypothetical protein